MSEVPQPPRLDDMEDPTKSMKDTLAKRVIAPEASKVELPDAPFEMSDDEFREMTKVGDLPLRRAPKEGEAVILRDGSNADIATEVTQPYPDQTSHYRFKVRGKIVHANVVEQKA